VGVDCQHASASCEAVGHANVPGRMIGRQYTSVPDLLSADKGRELGIHLNSLLRLGHRPALRSGAQSRTLATVPKIVKHVHLTYMIWRRYRNGKLTTAVSPIDNSATRNPTTPQSP